MELSTLFKVASIFGLAGFFSFFFTPSLIKIHPCSPYKWRGNMHEDTQLGRKGFEVFKSKWKLSQRLIWKYSVGPYAIIINVVFPSFCSILEQNNLCRPREQGEIVQKKRLQSPNDRYGNVLSRQIPIGLPHGYMIHMGKYVFRLITCVIQRKILSRTLDLRIPYRGSDLFLCPTLVTRRKTTFSISLPS